jgi:hypothetical protein
VDQAADGDDNQFKRSLSMKLTTHLKWVMLGAACVASLALLTLADTSLAQFPGGKKGKKAKAEVVEVDLSKLPPGLAKAVRRYVQGEDERGTGEGKGWKGKKWGEFGKWKKDFGGFGKGKKGFAKGFAGKKGPRVITVQPGERVIIVGARDGEITDRREGKGPPDWFGKKKGKGKKQKGGADDE